MTSVLVPVLELLLSEVGSIKGFWVFFLFFFSLILFFSSVGVEFGRAVPALLASAREKLSVASEELKTIRSQMDSFKVASILRVG
jgi:hypothetical protein